MSCVDVIVVKQRDGTLKSSPFVVRFNQRAPRTLLVRISIDGVPLSFDDSPSRSIMQVLNNNAADHDTFLVLDKDEQYCVFKRRRKRLPPPPSASDSLIETYVDDKSIEDGYEYRECDDDEDDQYDVERSSRSSSSSNSFDLEMTKLNKRNSSSEHVKEQKIGKLLDMDDDTSGSFMSAVESGLLDEDDHSENDVDESDDERLNTRKRSSQSSVYSSYHDDDNDNSGDDDGYNGSSSVYYTTTNKSRTQYGDHGNNINHDRTSSSLNRHNSNSSTSSSSSRVSGSYYDRSTLQRKSSGGSTTSQSTQQQRGFFDSWLESIDNETRPYDKLVPHDSFLQKLNLTKERTRITYECMGEKIEGRLFLWDSQDKCVISDVDGTITKSDILGQIFSRLGRDYTHPGIPSLFTKIAARGYRLLYLTARPITDGQMTREYIEHVKQGNFTMPIAPVITTPNTTWSALAREVIIRRPETFKISILRFIGSLFDENPFVAGWGNRATDCTSYIAVGVDPKMSFRVNSKGEIVVHHSNTFFSSHMQFEKKLDGLKMFPNRNVKLPPIPQNLVRSSAPSERDSSRPLTPREQAEEDVKNLVEQEQAHQK